LARRHVVREGGSLPASPRAGRDMQPPGREGRDGGPQDLAIGDVVRTGVPLGGIPAGALAVVREVAHPFTAVELLNGRMAYYAPRQLEPVGVRRGRLKGCPARVVEVGLAQACVPAGTHLCLLTVGDREAGESLAAYAATGLKSGELVLMVFPREWQDGVCRSIADQGLDVAHALAGGGLVLKDVWDCYYCGRDLTAERQINRLGEWLAEMASNGDRHLRLGGHPGGAWEQADADEWWEYERRVTPLAQATQALTLCSYLLAGGTEGFSELAQATHTHLLTNDRLAAATPRPSGAGAAATEQPR